jgi:8-oxo-dGTP pyrophosphatase MutT (NUDIX family)
VHNEREGPAVPRSAATVILVRPRAPRGLSVYMIRRSTKSRFMPDIHVFPGGAVDPADRDIAVQQRIAGVAPRPAAELTVAALRELFEEAGILIACDARGEAVALGDDELAALRAERAAGTAFAELLARHDLRLDARELAYYSNWVTPERERIRFDAHFFLARAPERQSARADAVEVHDGEWLTPADALARAARGEFAIIFPTRMHLERLAAFDGVDALFAHAREREVRRVMPVEHEDGLIAFASEADRAW